MSTRLSTLSLALIASGAALVGCASPEAPRFHSLQNLEAVSQPAPAPGPALRVQLSTVSVPAAVDQPQWLVRMPDQSLRLLEQERWVAPLRDELRDAVMTGLRQRWQVQDARLGSNDAPATEERVRLQLDVTRFETLSAQGAWIEAQWRLIPRAPQAPTVRCQATVRDPGAGDALALAAAHRRALTQLTDAIGHSLRHAQCPNN